MRTKREQVQAHRFVIRRIVSAMVGGEPETLDLPMRRLSIAAAAGTAITLLVFAGFWVVGLMFPGGADSWKTDGAIVIEEETGARFVYWDGQLHPVLNYASALLIAAEGDGDVHLVHQSSLADTPRGRMLGIPDAPDALPESDRFTSTPWQTCSAPDAFNPTERDSHVLIGSEMEPGTKLGSMSLLLESDGRHYLAIGDTKYRVPSDNSLPALGTNAEQAVDVDSVLVNSLRTGPDLVVKIPKKGEPGRELAGETYEIGSVFSNNGKFYVLVDDGLAPIGELAAELIGTARVELPTAVVGQNQSKTTIEPEDFPKKRPTVVEGIDSRDTAICSVFDDGVLELMTHSPIPKSLALNAQPAPVGEKDEIATADHVSLPGGFAALIRAEVSPGAAGGTIYLITDQGWKYGMSTETIEAFGYQKVKPTTVPSSMLALLPTGPVLSQGNALLPLQ
ncbi:type VII secretion protein EccB [Stackebrandtia soli]|uniref:type VII secretion protein EccB n=1 Tax=Stackebrandtia soli TaxID=1892856 RepID=UPI0039EBB440